MSLVKFLSKLFCKINKTANYSLQTYLTIMSNMKVCKYHLLRLISNVVYIFTLKNFFYVLNSYLILVPCYSHNFSTIKIKVTFFYCSKLYKIPVIYKTLNLLEVWQDFLTPKKYYGIIKYFEYN